MGRRNGLPNAGFKSLPMCSSNQIKMTHKQMTERASAQIEIDYLREQLLIAREKLRDRQTLKGNLKKMGYYTDNLWCTADVTENYSCTEEEAQGILNIALKNPAVVDQIFLAIDYAAESLNIKKTFNL
jgi:hypothetical protein